MDPCRRKYSWNDAEEDGEKKIVLTRLDGPLDYPEGEQGMQAEWAPEQESGELATQKSFSEHCLNGAEHASKLQQTQVWQQEIQYQGNI